MRFAVRRQRGFTLFEVLLVLAVIAIATGVALPSLLQWTQRNRLQTLESGLQRLLQEGRRAACQDGTMRFLRLDALRGELVLETHRASNGKSTMVRQGSAQPSETEPVRRMPLPPGSFVKFRHLETLQNLDRISIPASGLMEPIGIAIQTPRGLKSEWTIHRYTGVFQVPRPSTIP